MKMSELLEMIKRELTALGRGWRMDYSDFDGRTLRNQLNYIIKAIDENNISFNEFTDFLRRRSE
jgi:hypothetical protein